MVFLQSAKCAAFLILGLTALSIQAGDAAAKSKAVQQSGAEWPHTESKRPSADFVPPVRFFTIKQVLAKFDAGVLPEKGGSVLPQGEKFASASSGITSDVPADSSKALYSDDPFGLSFFRAPEGILWQKWRRLEAEVAEEFGLINACLTNRTDCTPAAGRFVHIVNSIKSLDGRARLEAVNQKINGAVRYTSDLMQHSVLDRWSPPLATLEAGRGDCEDYAIAKYFALREAGVPRESLKLLLVRDRSVREDHAVLAVRQDERWLILDNRHPRLIDDVKLRHFTPLFALDHEGVKLFAAPYAERENLEGMSPAAVSANDDPWSNTINYSGSAHWLSPVTPVLL